MFGFRSEGPSPICPTDKPYWRFLNHFSMIVLPIPALAIALIAGNNRGLFSSRYSYTCIYTTLTPSAGRDIERYLVKRKGSIAAPQSKNYLRRNNIWNDVWPDSNRSIFRSFPVWLYHLFSYQGALTLLPRSPILLVFFVRHCV
ncbi:hypothetical protein UFOVP276_243 [uncultured Caudovirales phage]|uniref:Uncharacterized protein n=1 Tax=uncultured Caudovirales phage TaxID=2100421 RepID=A0A6J5LQJ8_9CAUD|nr:hypothetical protein UFOVP127_137 [uncultured Caudovirales phage]CAB4135287.1 hypothetical protein UFOVP276_243 [uncultured Caudovirales phage]